MAKKKFDGVVEAVRYGSDGQVKWVRAYVRRGPTFSDRVLLNRQDLIAQLKSGKQFLVGKRIPQMASTFQVSDPINLSQKNGQDILISGAIQSERDCLEGVPLV